MSPARVVTVEVNEQSESDMKKRGTNGRSKSKVSNPNTTEAAAPKSKRKFEHTQDAVNTRKMPKRSAACKDFKEKPAQFSEKSSMIEKRREQIVEEELEAIALTAGNDDPRPNRRLTEFIFHDAEGQPQPVEMLEMTDIFISGIIMPMDESSGKEKEKGIRCNGFGRLESWAISGYEEGSPVIWVSTELADYDCVKPSSSYKNMYSLFNEKAHACIEVYHKLTKACGGDPDLCIEDLLAKVVRSMSERKSLSNKVSVKEFILSQGEFIYNQLVGLEESSKKKDQSLSELPALVALREESLKNTGLMGGGMGSCHIPRTTLRIRDDEKSQEMDTSADGENEDMKLARLLQEKENWKSARQNKRQRTTTPSSKYYIKINEDEIANDYPLPAYYKSSVEEIDEYVVFEGSIDANYSDDLPRSMLHNWALYDSDSRLISLELLPMKPCADIDVTIYGSGSMTTDDGTGFCLDGEAHGSSSSSQDVDGLPIYLSAIKEWMIEFGSSMVFISIRTDMAWYRLGKPSKQYAPWYEPVLRTARLAISTITLLKEQSRVSRLSFSEVVNRLSQFDKDHPAYISSNKLLVERYVVVHGQIILQQFAEFPDDTIRKSAFVTGLQDKMEQKHHTKWLVKKKLMLKKEANTNPRAQLQSVVSKRKAMPATTTRLINRIWGQYYSNYSPEDTKEKEANEVKEEEVDDEPEDDVEDLEEAGAENEIVAQKIEKPASASKPRKACSSKKEIKWFGEVVGETCKGEALYKQAIVRSDTISVGCAVLVETEESTEYSPIYFVEYLFEDSDGKQMAHGRMMMRACQTVLGNTGNERELFLTEDCLEFELGDIMQPVSFEIRMLPWGHQHRKSNAAKDKIDREIAEDRKVKGLPMEYFCKSVYSPDKGGFFSLLVDSIGLGSGLCSSCILKQDKTEKEIFKVHSSQTGFRFEGIEYCLQDFVYISPGYFNADEDDCETHKGGRNVGLRAYVVCQLLEIKGPKSSKSVDAESFQVQVRRFYRPEDVSAEKAYHSDVHEVYYSEDIITVPLTQIEGKCQVHKKQEFLSMDTPGMFKHVFFCESSYDHVSGAIKQLPAKVKLSSPKEGFVDDAAIRKKKGKCIEGDNGFDELKDMSSTNSLVTLDIFAGCGGLSEGLEKSGVSKTKWAIEYEEPAGEAFRQNHPEALVLVNNCNVILRAIMAACGDVDDCISTEEAIELAAKLDEKEILNLPRPGQVDFINGGPPCQGFSGMNRFNQSSWSKVQCEMILAFLSFADYFRPKYFLLENVRNFVSFNKGQTFRLAIASLLEIGYQVRFGILDAGAYGVSQSRKRAFIWAASPEELLPEWPEPMHVFSGPELKITLDQNTQYAAARSTSNGAPFRAITVRDTIGDLPDVKNGASATTMGYKDEPASWYQKKIRGKEEILIDHITKEMNELNLIRCKKIPKRPGADWRDLPDEKVRLSNGQLVDLIPWCLPNTAKRHNQWKGLFGRLDWEGNFPTSITDPQPMGKVGMCFHPEQDRIITVRECARSQGFPDSYKLVGNIQHKYRQIGNAVPPPLAYALGRKLREAVEEKSKSR